MLNLAKCSIPQKNRQSINQPTLQKQSVTIAGWSVNQSINQSIEGNKENSYHVVTMNKTLGSGDSAGQQRFRTLASHPINSNVQNRFLAATNVDFQYASWNSWFNERRNRWCSLVVTVQCKADRQPIKSRVSVYNHHFFPFHKFALCSSNDTTQTEETRAVQSFPSINVLHNPGDVRSDTQLIV